jgi:hypothetical protein
MLLGEMLARQDLATQEDIDAALERQRAEGGRLGNHLVALGVLTVGQLLSVLRDQKDIDAAIELCEYAVAERAAKFGDAHETTSRARYRLARAYRLGGRYADALTQATIAADRCRATLGAEHAATRDAEQLADEARQALAQSDAAVAQNAG